MGYDLHLFRPQPGVEPSITAEVLFASDSDELDQDIANPIEWQTKQAVASALINKNPNLDIFPSDLATTLSAATGSKGEEQSGYIELTDTEDDTGIQISIFDEEISVTVPYWHTGEMAKAIFRKIWAYVEVIQRIAGCFTYDSQLGRVINLNSDFNDVVSVYASVTAQFKDDAEK